MKRISVVNETHSSYLEFAYISPFATAGSFKVNYLDTKDKKSAPTYKIGTSR